MSRGKRRTAWLGQPDNEIAGELNSGTASFKLTAFDFGSANKYADNYGGGDWVVERQIGSFAIASTGARTASGIVKVCFGVGSVGGYGSTADSSVSQTQLPENAPELSWLGLVCCYINLEQLSVERCQFEWRTRRKVHPEWKLIWVVQATDAIPVGEAIEFRGHERILLSQKGSRV